MIDLRVVVTGVVDGQPAMSGATAADRVAARAVERIAARRQTIRPAAGDVTPREVARPASHVVFIR